MALEEKKERVKQINRLLEGCQAVFVVDYRGLRVVEITELRTELRKQKAVFRVVKNTLAMRSVRGGKLEGLTQWFSGPTGVVFVEGDPAGSAKVLADFPREHPNLNIKGGFLGVDLLDKNKVKELGRLPSREVLLSQVLSSFELPAIRSGVTGAIVTKVPGMGGLPLLHCSSASWNIFSAFPSSMSAISKYWSSASE